MLVDDCAFCFYEWMDFLDDDAFTVASSIPNSSRRGKYVIVLSDKIVLFDAADYDLALKMLRGELQLE